MRHGMRLSERGWDMDLRSQKELQGQARGMGGVRLANHEEGDVVAEQESGKGRVEKDAASLGSELETKTSPCSSADKSGTP